MSDTTDPSLSVVPARRCVCPPFTYPRECMALRYPGATLDAFDECDCSCHEEQAREDRDDD